MHLRKCIRYFGTPCIHTSTHIQAHIRTNARTRTMHSRTYAHKQDAHTHTHNTPTHSYTTLNHSKDLRAHTQYARITYIYTHLRAHRYIHTQTHRQQIAFTKVHRLAREPLSPNPCKHLRTRVDYEYCTHIRTHACNNSPRGCYR